MSKWQFLALLLGVLLLTAPLIKAEEDDYEEEAEGEAEKPSDDDPDSSWLQKPTSRKK